MDGLRIGDQALGHHRRDHREWVVRLVADQREAPARQLDERAGMERPRLAEVGLEDDFAAQVEPAQAAGVRDQHDARTADGDVAAAELIAGPAAVTNRSTPTPRRHHQDWRALGSRTSALRPSGASSIHAIGASATKRSTDRTSPPSTSKISTLLSSTRARTSRPCVERRTSRRRAAGS